VPNGRQSKPINADYEKATRQTTISDLNGPPGTVIDGIPTDRAFSKQRKRVKMVWQSKLLRVGQKFGHN
jgi:hypothetical protein